MSLNRIINKTPLANEKCNIYELEEITSDLISNIIQSRFAGEGVFGVEQYTVGDYREQYLSTPSFQKYTLPFWDKDWHFDLKEMSIYELVLEKPLFMPLDTKQFVDLLNMESEAMVFTQVLISKR
jgi:DNA segregation ATPase FtsK/SpoIIIE, S-DNA-T family